MILQFDCCCFEFWISLQMLVCCSFCISDSGWTKSSNSSEIPLVCVTIVGFECCKFRTIAVNMTWLTAWNGSHISPWRCNQIISQLLRQALHLEMGDVELPCCRVFWSVNMPWLDGSYEFLSVCRKDWLWGLPCICIWYKPSRVVKSLIYGLSPAQPCISNIPI